MYQERYRLGTKPGPSVSCQLSDNLVQHEIARQSQDELTPST